MRITGKFLSALLFASSSALAAETGMAPFEKDLSLQGVTFHVSSPNQGSINTLTIDIAGLQEKAPQIEKKIEGTVTGAEVADINSDGSPEIYVYVTSAGSGSYGSIAAYSVNKMKSATEIYLPPIAENKKLSKGYMGHDQFSIVEQYLVQRFPVYKEGDTNSKPSGGLRQIQYRLKAGEAGWILRPQKTLDLR